MDESDLLRESLRDITSLLILLHEKYIRGNHSVNLALLSFLEDAGLGESVTIVETEQFRSLAMKFSESLVMGHEEFYEWLRLVADFVYGVEDRRRALHKLLVQHIIPVARGEKLVKKRTKRWFERDHIQYLMKYFKFIMVWYCSFTSLNLVSFALMIFHSVMLSLFLICCEM